MDTDAAVNKRNVVKSCSNFVGQPLSRQQAEAKMMRSNTFRLAANEFGTAGDDNDVVSRAIQLDYGIRLRSCFQAGDVATSSTTFCRTKTVPY